MSPKKKNYVHKIFLSLLFSILRDMFSFEGLQKVGPNPTEKWWVAMGH